MPSHLRYCPECTSEDIQKHGETYWRRIHQLPGIMACHKHNQTLMNSTVRLSFLSKREYVVANGQNCSGSLSANLMETDSLHMRDLAKLANSILQGDYKAKQKDFFRKRYIEFLQEAGYVTEGGRVYKLSTLSLSLSSQDPNTLSHISSSRCLHKIPSRKSSFVTCSYQ